MPQRFSGLFGILLAGAIASGPAAAQTRASLSVGAIVVTACTVSSEPGRAATCSGDRSWRVTVADGAPDPSSSEPRNRPVRTRIITLTY